MTDYEQALAYAKAGQLEKAQALLLASDHPKADALLEKVNKAIAARGGSKAVTSQAVAEGTVNKAKLKPNRVRLLVVATGVLIILLIVAYFTAYVPSQMQTASFHRQFAVQQICLDAYLDYQIEHNISADGMVTACENEAYNAIRGKEADVDNCLAQSQGGTLKNTFIDCLVNIGLKFNGAWVAASQ